VNDLKRHPWSSELYRHEIGNVYHFLLAVCSNACFAPFRIYYYIYCVHDCSYLAPRWGWP